MRIRSFGVSLERNSLILLICTIACSVASKNLLSWFLGSLGWNMIVLSSTTKVGKSIRERLRALSMIKQPKISIKEFLGARRCLGRILQTCSCSYTPLPRKLKGSSLQTCMITLRRLSLTFGMRTIFRMCSRVPKAPINMSIYSTVLKAPKILTKVTTRRSIKAVVRILTLLHLKIFYLPFRGIWAT